MKIILIFLTEKKIKPMRKILFKLLLLTFSTSIFISCGANKKKLVGEWLGNTENNEKVIERAIENSHLLLLSVDVFETSDLLTYYVSHEKFRLKFTDKNKVEVFYDWTGLDYKTTNGGYDYEEATHGNSNKLFDYDLNNDILNLNYSYEANDNKKYLKTNRYEMNFKGDTLSLKLIVDDEEKERLKKCNFYDELSNSELTELATAESQLEYQFIKISN